MSWLESIIYAFVSGATEFLPVSSRAHQSILLQLFGVDNNPALFNLLIHIAALIALLGSCQTQLANLHRTGKILAIPPKRRKRQPDVELVSRRKLFKAGVFPVLALSVLFFLFYRIFDQLQWLAVSLLINGAALYILGHISIGNKTAQHMSGIEAFLIGAASGFGILPGISRIGAGSSVAVMRGASHKDALEWSLVLSVPALIALCVIDVILMFTGGIGDFGFIVLVQYLFGALIAYAGSFFSIMLMRFLANKVGFSWFSYYCWGLALFSFILFMI